MNMFILMTADETSLSAFSDYNKLEFPWTNFFISCNFVLLLLKKEQGYFPLFPSIKHHPLGCFLLCPFLSFFSI